MRSLDEPFKGQENAAPRSEAEDRRRLIELLARLLARHWVRATGLKNSDVKPINQKYRRLTETAAMISGWPLIVFRDVAGAPARLKVARPHANSACDAAVKNKNDHGGCLTEKELDACPSLLIDVSSPRRRSAGLNICHYRGRIPGRVRLSLDPALRVPVHL